MFEIRGKYNIAKIFTTEIDEVTTSQIINLCNNEIFKDCNIAIMPDVHAGNDCVIGCTIAFKDKIIPNLIGNDIGCGVLTIKLNSKELNLKAIDEFIKKTQDKSFQHKNKLPKSINNLLCYHDVNLSRIQNNLGDIGGGNHFIEIDKDSEDNYYLIIHTGSRYLGKQICKYYQDLGFKELNSDKEKVKNLIKTLKSEGKQKEIESKIKAFKKNKIKVNKSTAYISGKLLDQYLHDMEIAQEYAKLNRKTIADLILKEFNLKAVEEWDTIHNYIEIEKKIMRKGAIRADLFEKVTIPLNMKDGCLIALGKGNKEWNCSAPHGAGRIFSRSQAKNNLNIEEFKKDMEGVYTSTANINVIDESPRAYKNPEDIISNVCPTITIVEKLQSVYSFKKE